MKRVEAAIQKEVLRWVKEQYPDVIITATANERSYKEVDQIGCLGIQDILIFKVMNGVMHIYFLELKSKKGRLLKSQIDFNILFDSKFACDNAKRDVAYGLIEAKEKVMAWINSINHVHS